MQSCTQIRHHRPPCPAPPAARLGSDPVRGVTIGRLNGKPPPDPGNWGTGANGEPCTVVAGRPCTRAVGEGASTQPLVMDERMGTGATTSVVCVRRFSGIPKVAAFRRISAPGDSAMLPKVAGEAGPAPGRPMAYTT